MCVVVNFQGLHPLAGAQPKPKGDQDEDQHRDKLDRVVVGPGQHFGHRPVGDQDAVLINTHPGFATVGQIASRPYSSRPPVKR